MSITTLNARTADPQIKPFGFIDQSGSGSGPYFQMHAEVDASGNPITTANPKPVQVIGWRPFEAALTITRPANTTPYAVGQVLSGAVSGLTAFPALALGVGSSQRVTIKSVTILSSNGAAATKGQFALYLFNSPSPSGGGFNDAASFAPTAAALGAIGNDLIDFIPDLFQRAGSAAYGYALSNDNRQALTDSSGNLYAAVVLNNVYTPANGETIVVKISGTY